MSKNPVHPFDLLAIDSLLSPEEIEIRSWVRKFSDNELRPNIREWFEKSTTPTKDLMHEFGKLGLFAMNNDGKAPVTTNAVAYGLACMEFDAVDSAFRSCLSVQNSLVIYPILRYGSEEQKAQYLPGLISGADVGAFGLTEADHGSDPSSMKTNVRKDGADWILNGSKMWITNASIAKLFIVWAQSDDGIVGFIVPANAPGVSVQEIHGKLSMRASKTGVLTFENVRLPDSARLPEASGLKAPLSCLTEARYGIIFGVMGAARDSIEVATKYALDRKQFDRELASFQLTQGKLAEMSASLLTGTLLAIHLGRMKQSGKITPEMISYGKFNNVKSALEVSRQARTILGAAGITLDYSPLRHSNNLETVLTYEGTHEIHLLTIGRALTGIQAFK